MIDLSLSTAPLDGTLRIAEIFASVQGEGIWIGVPSTFVRVSGCNLRCSWCDTPYASWSPEGDFRSVGSIVDEVVRLQPKHVVVTGGEPMLFEPVENLTHRFAELGYKITIETAGTVFREVSCDLMSISPKLSNSTPEDPVWSKRHEDTRLKREPLIQLVERYSVQLKFVVQSSSDISEVEALLQGLPPLEPEQILLMPEGRDSASLWAKARTLVPLCLERGWRLAPRMQIDLFGDTRGT